MALFTQFIINYEKQTEMKAYKILVEITPYGSNNSKEFVEYAAMPSDADVCEWVQDGHGHYADVEVKSYEEIPLKISIKVHKQWAMENIYPALINNFI